MVSLPSLLKTGRLRLCIQFVQAAGQSMKSEMPQAACTDGNRTRFFSKSFEAGPYVNGLCTQTLRMVGRGLGTARCRAWRDAAKGLRRPLIVDAHWNCSKWSARGQISDGILGVGCTSRLTLARQQFRVLRRSTTYTKNYADIFIAAKDCPAVRAQGHVREHPLLKARRLRTAGRLRV